jgi:hypothetical protein
LLVIGQIFNVNVLDMEARNCRPDRAKRSNQSFERDLKARKRACACERCGHGRIGHARFGSVGHCVILEISRRDQTDLKICAADRALDEATKGRPVIGLTGDDVICLTYIGISNEITSLIH